MSEVEEVVLMSGKDISLFDVRVKIALAEKGIKYETKEEDDLPFEMNPVYKQISVLVHNGKPILNSLVILEYIDETWINGQGPNFLPSNPYERSRARIWADYVENKIYPTISKLWSQTEEEREDVGKELLELFKKVGEELGENDYFGGGSFGFVDIALIPFCSLFLSFRFLLKLDVEARCPTIFKWAERCSERESVSKNMPTQKDVLKFLRFLIDRINESGSNCGIL